MGQQKWKLSFRSGERGREVTLEVEPGSVVIERETLIILVVVGPSDVHQTLRDVLGGG